MKKLLSFLLALLIVLSFAACGAEKSGAFSAKDICLTVNGKTVTVDLSVSELLAALGDGYEYAEAVSCVYEGMDKTYTYPDAVVYTYPDGGTEHLMELYCSGGDVKTSRGIAIGSSRADVIAAYGEPTSEFGITVSYELAADGDMLPASLYFLIRGDAVQAIAITAEHRGE